MVQQLNQSTLELGGTPDQQALANQVWNLMRARGASYAITKPISLSLSMLADFFASQKYQGHDKPEAVAPLIDKALSASPAVFTREKTEVEVPQADDAEGPTTRQEVIFKTTKAGKAPVEQVMDQHSFKTRLFEGAQPVLPPTEEELAARAVEQARHPQIMPDLPVAAPSNQLIPTTQPTVSTPKPPVGPITSTLNTPTPAPVPAQRPATPAPQPAPTSVAATPATPVAPKPTTPAPTPQPVAQPAPTPVSPMATGPVMIQLADGVEVDLNQPSADLLKEYGEYFASALAKALEEDFRFVSFANDYFLEEQTNRYSKNDFRRIREYMVGSEGPVSDTALLSDVAGKRTNDHDYEAVRFSLNFRLFKEKKDFEFVGVNDDRIWTAPGLPQIGNPRHKATEVGTDYKYLEDPELTDPAELVEENGRKVWRHVLTFYEYENGVLPYDATAKKLFPAALMEDQKSVVLRFEAPQLDFTYSAELRFPTGSRGGWIGGLEQFFEENLLPGAILIMRQGRRSNHFTIEYEQGEERENIVLFYDDRRQKFVFRPVVFACGVNPEGMLTNERYGKLNGQKRLEESDRKKTDLVVANAFEYASQRTTQGYYALLDDLYPVANIERPFSHNYMRQLLGHGNSQFQADESTPDAFYYKPPTTGVRR